MISSKMKQMKMRKESEKLTDQWKLERKTKKRRKQQQIKPISIESTWMKMAWTAVKKRIYSKETTKMRRDSAAAPS